MTNRLGVVSLKGRLLCLVLVQLKADNEQLESDADVSPEAIFSAEIRGRKSRFTALFTGGQPR